MVLFDENNFSNTYLSFHISMEHKNAQRNQLVMGIAGGALLLALIVWLAFFFGGNGLQSSLLGGSSSTSGAQDGTYGTVTPLDSLANPGIRDTSANANENDQAPRDPFSPNPTGAKNDGVTPIYPDGYIPASVNEQLP